MDEDRRERSSGDSVDDSEKSPEKPTIETEEEGPIVVEDIETPSSIPVPRESHAFPLALIIVCTFAASIGAAFAYLFLKCDFQSGVELFKTISAVLSGPLGFVLGYYFRVTQAGS